MSATDVKDTILTLATLVRLHEGNRDLEINALISRAITCADHVSELLEALSDFDGIAEPSMPGTPERLRRLRDAYARCVGSVA